MFFLFVFVSFNVFVFIFLGCFVVLCSISIGFLREGVFFCMLFEFVKIKCDFVVKLWKLMIFKGLIKCILLELLKCF